MCQNRDLGLDPGLNSTEYSKFAYGEGDDPLKLCRGKDCVENFCDHIKKEAHRLYHMFPVKPIDPLTNR